MKSEERKFLHDISSPVTSLQLNLENAVTLIEESSMENRTECLQLLELCRRQVRRTAELIQERRKIVIQEENA